MSSSASRKLISIFIDLLQHPLTRGLDLDDSSTTEIRTEIIRRKPFLRNIYLEWYKLIRDSLPPSEGAVLELGSGAGFLPDIIPGVVTSEIFPIANVKLVLDGQRLPFAPASLRAIVMTDVFHHLPDCRRFLEDAARCVRPEGAIVAIEPWVTPWSRLVLTRFHHEPFDPETREWVFPSKGPLTSANGALAWVVFERDRNIFEMEFPQWRVQSIRPFMPFRYLAAGGISLRSLAPAWSFNAFRLLETLLTWVAPQTAMFAHIVLSRTSALAESRLVCTAS